MFRYAVLRWALLLHPRIIGVAKVVALTLTSGQRIEPLPRSFSDMPESLITGLLDLRAVEYWASQEDVKEQHLKTLYCELLRKSSRSEESSLFQRLVDNDVPHAAATSLLLHNQSPFKFVECTSKILSVSPSPANGGGKLTIQYDGEDGPIVETVLIRHESTQHLTQQLQKNVDQPASKRQRPRPTARYTVCVSSQVGCARGCTFCATGTMGLRRNLSSS
jgi:adenine C2-methylase RlmN of 23S rRNA A2503 and tRNA A37